MSRMAKDGRIDRGVPRAVPAARRASAVTNACRYLHPTPPDSAIQIAKSIPWISFLLRDTFPRSNRRYYKQLTELAPQVRNLQPDSAKGLTRREKRVGPRCTHSQKHEQQQEESE